MDEFDFVIRHFGNHPYMVDYAPAIGPEKNQVAFADFIIVKPAPYFSHVVRGTRQSNVEFLERAVHQSRAVKTIWCSTTRAIVGAQVFRSDVNKLLDHIACVVSVDYVIFLVSVVDGAPSGWLFGFCSFGLRVGIGSIRSGVVVAGHIPRIGLTNRFSGQFAIFGRTINASFLGFGF